MCAAEPGASRGKPTSGVRIWSPRSCSCGWLTCEQVVYCAPTASGRDPEIRQPITVGRVSRCLTVTLVDPLKRIGAPVRKTHRVESFTILTRIRHIRRSGAEHVGATAFASRLRQVARMLPAPRRQRGFMPR